MDNVVLYHWWGQGGKVAHNMTFPVILSIATLRAHNPDVPIVVMDLSQGLQDWEEYQLKLNFKVERISPFLPLDLDRYGFRPTFWHAVGETNTKPIDLHMMSRPFDYWKCGQRQTQNKVLGCDSDIFWLRDPFPLVYEDEMGKIPQFVVDGNLGLFYYDKRSKEANKTGNIWMAFCLQAIYDPEFRREIIEVTPHYPNIIDEMIMNWAIIKNIANTQDTHRWENFHISGLRSYVSREEILTKVKNVHLLFSICGNQRGRFCQCIKELYDALLSVLPQSDLDDIFGEGHERRMWSIADFHKSVDKNFSKTNAMWEFLGQGKNYCQKLEQDFKETKQILQEAQDVEIKKGISLF